jgi:deferrochelatase/peroxidase EfeB
MRLVALSSPGLSRFDVPWPLSPADPSGLFGGGLAERWAELNDPQPQEWDEPYRSGIDALVLLSASDREAAFDDLRRLFGTTADLGVAVVGVEVGERLRNRYGESIEHFGYVDGSSQPRFFTGDVEAEELRNRFHDWSAAAAPRQVLVPCGRGGELGYGTFMVYRKLAQDVRAFREALAARSVEGGGKGSWEETERLGGLLVGRLPDGRPIAYADQLPSPIPVENGFSYDGAGAGCPLAAHVRVMNPRVMGRRLLPARRGIPYGRRAVDPASARSVADLPSDGVGLLFVAVMADLGRQFEELQQAANGREGDGSVDPLIGRVGGGSVPRQRWADPGTGRTVEGRLGGYVHLLGGEYLYVPSPGFLTELRR